MHYLCTKKRGVMSVRLPKFVKSWYFVAILLGVAAVVALTFYTFFGSMSNEEGVQYVYIDDDDTVDSVFVKVEGAANNHRIHGFKILSRYNGYTENIHTGAYTIEPGASMWKMFRKMKRGEQTPIKVTIPSVRTMGKLAKALSGQLMIDSATIASRLMSQEVCGKYGYDTATIACMIIPDTYEMYWNVSADHLLNNMQKQANNFWNSSRMSKAKALGLSPREVVTLASIVDEETANDGEKPTIAGLYYNRLQKGMLLQADPTVLYANNSFGARRVYNRDLTVDSPYNTYKYKGLPPGPIRIPSVAGIDAVLNMEEHDYLYMCAKEDFSGTHNYATTLGEHMQNARRYSQALNERGIK